jgi:hypothetical protein
LDDKGGTVELFDQLRQVAKAAAGIDIAFP